MPNNRTGDRGITIWKRPNANFQYDRKKGFFNYLTWCRKEMKRINKNKDRSVTIMYEDRFDGVYCRVESLPGDSYEIMTVQGNGIIRMVEEEL